MTKLRAVAVALIMMLGISIAGIPNAEAAGIRRYVAGFDSGINAAGAYAVFEGDKPQLQGAAHSLVEMAVIDNTPTGRQIVEVGWTVSPGVNGDAQPRLFVYAWKDGQPTCYNLGCGFVANPSATSKPKDIVPVGSRNGFAIQHHAGAWWVWYKDSWIGHYPDTLWGGRFTAADQVMIFGEVADPRSTFCADMGDGRYGTDPNSTQISGYRLLGNKNTAPGEFDFVTDAAADGYRKGNVTATSFTLGGPGRC